MFQTQASNQTIYRMVMASVREKKNYSNELIEVLCTPFRPHKHCDGKLLAVSLEIETMYFSFK